MEDLEATGIWIDKDGVSHEEPIGELYLDPGDEGKHLPDEIEIDGYHYEIRR